MKHFLRGAVIGAFLFVSAAMAAETPTRKQVLVSAAKVADWQLARMDGLHITSHMSGESREPRSWQQGAFWVGMTHLAHTSAARSASPTPSSRRARPTTGRRASACITPTIT